MDGRYPVQSAQTLHCTLPDSIIANREDSVLAASIQRLFQNALHGMPQNEFAALRGVIIENPHDLVFQQLQRADHHFGMTPRSQNHHIWIMHNANP